MKRTPYQRGQPLPYHKTKVIFNPAANIGRAWPLASALRPVAESFTGVEWTETTHSAHAARLARTAALEGCDLVVAIGGDGTVHEVVNGLMQIPANDRPALGVVPVGSGNDFAFSLGMPGDPEAALRQVLCGTPRPVDVGRIQDGNGRTEFFSNTVGIGFDAIVVIHSRNVPVLQGFAVYLIAVFRTLLFNHHPFFCTIETDQRTWQNSLLMLAVCNGQREGGGFHLVPDGKNNDGWLDTVALHRVSRSKLLLKTLVPFLKGTHQSLEHVSLDQVRSLSLQSNIPLIIHTDGEIFTGFGSDVRQLRFEIFPAALCASC
jgi:YegS/Rv2252/BmrU family lipid kinase